MEVKKEILRRKTRGYVEREREEEEGEGEGGGGESQVGGSSTSKGIFLWTLFFNFYSP